MHVRTVADGTPAAIYQPQIIASCSMPSVSEILDAFTAAGASASAVSAIKSLELPLDDLLDLAPADVWGVGDADAVRIAGVLGTYYFGGPARAPPPPGPPPPPPPPLGALPAVPPALSTPPAPPRPRCLVVAGPPGSGKTTMAAQAAAQMRAALIDKDALEWPLARAALNAAGAAKDDAYYNSTVKPAAYETCFRVAEQNCRHGLDVVLVAPFTSHVRDAGFLADLEKRFEARVALVWVVAAPDVLRARQLKRGADQDTSLLLALPQGPACPCVTVDTSRADEADLAQITGAALEETFAQTRRARVLCAGHACVDVVLEGCNELESREGYCAVESTRLAAGGSVANCGSTLAALENYGVDAHCALGKDAFGAFLLDFLREKNVGTSHVRVDARYPTSTACLPVYKRDGKRAVYCAQGWNARFAPDPALCGKYDLVVLGYPHVMPAVRGAPLRSFAARCVAEGTCLALDVNEATDDASTPLGTGDAYANVGVLHGNLDEAAACVGRKRELLARYDIGDGLENVLPPAEVAAIARALLGRGCGVVLLTLGPRGAFAATNDAETLKRTLGRIPHGLAPAATSRRAAFKAGGAIDTVGAGDAFLAGALASLLAGGDLDRVLDVGLAAALWRVDTSRSSAPPRREALEGLLGGLARLPTVAGA